MKVKLTMILVCLGLLHGVANAGTVTLNGYLNDSSNSALVGSDMGAALFGNNFEIANNVALYPLLISVGGVVNFHSNGFAAGGVDPYFTLFHGSGNTAAFLGSNYAQAFSTGGDFNLNFTLVTGNYVVALGSFANMSFAENLGAGTLGDGFSGIGEPNSLGNYYYQLDVLTIPQSVPEPGSVLLLPLGLLGIAACKRRLQETPERWRKRSNTTSFVASSLRFR